MSTYEDALEVTEFTFDPTDPGFLEYAEHQAVLHKAGVPGSRMYQFVMDHGATKEEFLRDECPEQMEAHWETLRAAKGSLQLCWEEYQRCWEEYYRSYWEDYYQRCREEDYRSCWREYRAEMENQM